jgi:hypothetical protein
VLRLVQLPCWRHASEGLWSIAATGVRACTPLPCQLWPPKTRYALHSLVVLYTLWALHRWRS